ncbi:MAG: phage integrase SAM-like domain-containing protein [Bacteroidota bacterium]
MKPTITLKPIFHRNAEQIGIFLKNNLALNIRIRKEAGGIWSQTKKCWYIPISLLSFDKLKAALTDHVLFETTELKKFLEEKKKKQTVSKSLVVKNTLLQRSVHVNTVISPVNRHVLPAMKEMLTLKAFSPSTMRTYLNEMAQLLQAIKDIPADKLTTDLLKRYLVYCYEKLGLKENTLHSRINAM